MKTKSITMMLSTLLILAFMACGREQAREESIASKPDADAVRELENFAARKTVEEAEWYMVDYDKFVYEKPQGQVFQKTYQFAEAQDFFVLDTSYLEDDIKYQLTQIDVQTKEAKSDTLDPKLWGIAEGSIMEMDRNGSEGYIYWITVSDKDSKDWAIEHVYAVYTDNANNKKESYEITNFFTRDTYLTEGMPLLRSDAAGHTYVIDDKQNKVFMLSKEGELIKEHTFPAISEYNMINSFLTEEGERILVHQSENGSRLVWLNTENGNIKELAVEKELGNVEEWYGIYGNILYYALDNKLIGWNIVTGEQRCMLDYKENSITKANYISLLPIQEEIQLLVTEKAKRYIMTFSPNPKEELSNIEVVNICGDNRFLKGQVITFSRENPQYAVKYMDSYESDDNSSRIIMEVANGKGPDVLYIPFAELENLQRKDALADWEKILSEETLDVIYPGILSMGTRNGKLYGLPLSVYARTLLVNKTYWDGDTWTIEDILQILEENPEVKGIFLDVFGQDNYFYNMRYTLGFDLKNLPEITDNMTNFQTPSFHKLLKNIKEKSNNIHVMAPLEGLQSGEYLGIEYVINDFVLFSSLCDKAGDKGGIVGYPTNTGCGNYIYSEGILVVNQKAENKEGISELIESLFSLESQEMLELAISVRKDTYDKKTFYNEDNGKHYLIGSDGSWAMLKTKEDGSTYYEEYQDFLMHAAPYDFSDDVFDIIYEEAESYFYSGKEIEEVADVIQSRVELYLEERQ